MHASIRRPFIEVKHCSLVPYSPCWLVLIVLSHRLVGWLNVCSLPGKTQAIHETIEDKQSVCVLTETWHHSSDDICLRRSAPHGYAVVDAVRESDPAHGGIVVFYRSSYSCSKLTLQAVTTFEYLCTRICIPGGSSFIFFSVYRPGSCRPSTLFHEELTCLLELLIVRGGPIIIGGDFNIHVEDPDDREAIRFADLLSSFGLDQHVKESTHRYGGTLDLVVTDSDVEVGFVTVDPPGIISDHGLVTSSLPIHRSTVQPSTRFVRSWRRVDRQSLYDAIKCSPLGNTDLDPSLNASNLFELYDTTLLDIADQFAPLHSVVTRNRPLSPWFDAECRATRRYCRMLENRYRRSKDPGDRMLWTDAVCQKHRSFREKENLYWASKIAQDGDNPTKLWRSLSSVMRKNTNSSSQSVQSTITAENFLKFFHDKVAAVRASTDGNETLTSSTPASSSLTDFASFTSEELRRIIMNSPSKSCSLDPIPTFILKEVIDIVLPFLTVMCNASLQEGLLSVSQRHAIITPLLKKQSLDPTELKNYRPVSNLTFMSKIG